MRKNEWILNEWKSSQNTRVITPDQAEAFFFNYGYLEAQNCYHILELMLAVLIFWLDSMCTQKNVDSTWSLD